VSRGKQKSKQSGGSSVTDRAEPQRKNHCDYSYNQKRSRMESDYVLNLRDKIGQRAVVRRVGTPSCEIVTALSVLALLFETL
jgi:hypothetical protein